jgi:carboxyl-terminal processing protease
VLRESDSEPLEITITRDIIKIQSVRHQVFDDIGYLRITSFSQKTDAGVREAIKKMKKDIPNMKGMVLDLRNNPGGLLDQAVAVSDDFLEQGEVVSTRERNPSNTRRYTAHPGDLINGKPIVVLINQGSASASEIVAGALQDHNRAVIMGTKSFGKGSVQTVIPLDSHGAMRLTTSRYYTPSGTSIQAKGIMPDIIVEQAKIEQEDTKKRRSEANLPGRLKNDQGDEEEEKPTSRRNRKVDPNKDFQLARAVDLLRGVAVFDSLDSRQY